MSDPTRPRPAYRRRSVSESDNDLMNSATSCQTYPRQLVSPGQTDSYPSISGLRTTEEPTYNGNEQDYNLRIYYLRLELLRPLTDSED